MNGRRLKEYLLMAKLKMYSYKKPTDTIYQKMAAKYVGAVGAEKYVSNTIDQPRALFRVELAKAVVSSWRMPVADEPGMGIWAKRYFVPGTDF